MLLKCHTQYVSKFGKLSSSHRTVKGHFSFLFQRRAMPRNVQMIIHLHSFHMLARLCSKSCKLCFRSTWIKKFQMNKLGLEKVEESETKLPTSIGSWRKQESSRKTSTSASLTRLKPLTHESQQTLENFKEMGIPGYLTCLLRNLYADQIEPDIWKLIGSKLGKEYNKAAYCHPAYLTYIQSTSCKMPGWMNHKLESRLPAEISTISDMQMIPL